MAGFVVSALMGTFFGLGIGYLIGSEREPCEHQFEEIMNTHSYKSKTDVTVYMCKKCGKRKITKV